MLPPPIENTEPKEIVVPCPRCSKPQIKNGKKIIQKAVVVLMNPGMILYHCPKCSFECRPYDAKLNVEQVKVPVPVEIGIVQEMMKHK
ncbi:MAG: hypothetical protein KGH87_08380 [Thaumarchaeota archaeon]|nr:hypothetical protein [Nitrososphaerota archaeon]